MARLPCCANEDSEDRLQQMLVRGMQLIKAVEKMETFLSLCSELVHQEIQPVRDSLQMLNEEAQKIGGHSETINA